MRFLVAGLVALVAAGGASAAALARGTRAIWAELPGQFPNYIFPISSCCDTPTNINDFQELMYRPLYWFGSGSQPTVNPALSLARMPKFENGETTVVVNLRSGHRWSDGEPLDARDVVFFMDMLETVKSVDWGPTRPATSLTTRRA